MYACTLIDLIFENGVDFFNYIDCDILEIEIITINSQNQMINIGENIVEGEKIFLRYFFGASISCICVYTLVDGC